MDAAPFACRLRASLGGELEAPSSHYRLWIIASHDVRLPADVLHSSMTLALEQAEDIRGALSHAYGNLMNDEDLLEIDSCHLASPWRSLLFAVSMLHALILERRRVSTLGFSTPYAFGEQDLGLVFSELKSMVKKLPGHAKPSAISLPLLRYTVVEVAFGGHVTHEGDRAMLRAMYDSVFMGDQAVYDDGHLFSAAFDRASADDGGTAEVEGAEDGLVLGYPAPLEAQSISEHRRVFAGLPALKLPDAMGLDSGRRPVGSASARTACWTS